MNNNTNDKSETGIPRVENFMEGFHILLGTLMIEDSKSAENIISETESSPEDGAEKL